MPSFYFSKKRCAQKLNWNSSWVCLHLSWANYDGSVTSFFRQFPSPGNKFTPGDPGLVRSASRSVTLIFFWCSKRRSFWLLLMTANDSAFFLGHHFPNILPGSFHTQQPAVHTARGVTSVTPLGKAVLVYGNGMVVSWTGFPGPGLRPKLDVPVRR